MTLHLLRMRRNRNVLTTGKMSALQRISGMVSNVGDECCAASSKTNVKVDIQTSYIDLQMFVSLFFYYIIRVVN